MDFETFQKTRTQKRKDWGHGMPPRQKPKTKPRDYDYRVKGTQKYEEDWNPEEFY